MAGLKQTHTPKHTSNNNLIFKHDKQKTMKKILTLFSVMTLLMTWQAQAKVVTVSNAPSYKADFDDLQAAVDDDSVVSGDTVYVHPSGINYGNIEIEDKYLIFIGSGISPNKDLPILAIVTRFDLNNGATSGTVINGFKCQVILDSSEDIENISIINCHGDTNFYKFFFNITDGHSGAISNVLIQNCLSAGGIETRNNFSNLTVKNNVFYNDYRINSTPMAVFEHNLFIGSGGKDARSAITASHLNGTIVRNNTFYGSYMSCTGNVQANINNNLFYNIDEDLYFNGEDNQCGENASHYDNTLIEEGTAVLENIPSEIFTTWDFQNFDITLSENSPAKNAGTDGTDIGPSGGSNPFSISGEPGIPVVRDMQLENTFVPPGGTVKVTVKSSSGR